MTPVQWIETNFIGILISVLGVIIVWTVKQLFNRIDGIEGRIKEFDADIRGVEMKSLQDVARIEAKSTEDVKRVEAKNLEDIRRVEAHTTGIVSNYKERFADMRLEFVNGMSSVKDLIRSGHTEVINSIMKMQETNSKTFVATGFCEEFHKQNAIRIDTLEKIIEKINN